MAVAATAVGVLTLDYGRLPWVALILAFSFGSYGLAKKTANVGAIDSLVVETSVIAPVAAVYVGWLAATGQSSFAAHGAGHALLFATTGIVTAIPLICFGGAAIRVPMVTLGLLSTSRRSSSSPWACCGSTRTCPPAGGSASAWCGRPWCSSPSRP